MTQTVENPNRMTNAKFFGQFFKLMLIVAAQNSIVLGVNLADNIMLGKYADEVGLSAVAIANQIQFLLQMLSTGIGEGMIIVSSRQWGQGDKDGIRRALSVCMRVGMIASGALMLVVFFATGWVYSLFSPDPAVGIAGASYIRIACFTYMPFCASTLLLCSLRSSGQVRIGVWVSVAALLTNVTLNYALIFGKFGFPELGIPGAAIATLISRWVELVVVVIYMIFAEKKVGYRFRDFKTFDFGLLRELIKLGSPVLLCNVLWGIAMAVQSGILGHLGNASLTANNIATTIFQFVSVFSYSTAAATTVVIGNSIGRGEIDMLRKRALIFQIIFLGVGVVTGILLFLLIDPIVSIYNITDDTRYLTVEFMKILAITVVGTSYQVPVFSGIVRAGGETKFQMINDFIFMWGVVLPSAMLGAFVFELDMFYIFIFLKADQILKCFVAIFKVNRFNWLRIDGKKVQIP